MKAELYTVNKKSRKHQKLGETENFTPMVGFKVEHNNKPYLIKAVNFKHNEGQFSGYSLKVIPYPYKH